jgi:predicted RNase H-like nuclease (RuvC/YqgF family)
MIPVESLVNDLQKENSRLKEELEQAQRDIKDFETIAAIWKKGYVEDVNALKVKIVEYKQIIDSLQKELEECRLLDHSDET